MESRYQNHEKLEGFSGTFQSQLSQARVLIVGCGGLGSNTALFLAGAGVGTLNLIDHDRVQLKNLHRQVLFEERDVGRSKTEAAQRHLKARNDSIEVNSYHEMLVPENAQDFISRADAVVIGTDTFESRYLINDVCKELQKPMVHASVGGYVGEVCVFDGSRSACYRCLYPEADPLACDCEDSGVFGPLVGMVANIQAAETIKILTGIGRTLVNRLLRIDAKEMTTREFRISADPDCRSCGFDAAPFVTPTPFQGCDGETLKQLIMSGESILVDLRETTECASRCAQAISLPFTQFATSWVSLLAYQHKQIILFCSSGKRSEKALALLKSKSFKNVQHVKGGIALNPFLIY